MNSVRVIVKWLLLAAWVMGRGHAKQPEIQRITSVEYPRMALVGSMQGRLNVRAQIGPDGKAETVTYRPGGNLPYSDVIERSIKQWKFSDCQGKPSECAVDIEFIFTLDREICRSAHCPTAVTFEPPNRIRVKAKRIPAAID